MLTHDCFQVGEEVMEGFTKEVLMMWKEALAAEGGRCTAPKAGRNGTETLISGVAVMFRDILKFNERDWIVQI